MSTYEEVKKLAALVRIEVKEEELEQFTKEFDAIIAYVGQLDTATGALPSAEERPALHNVMREDGEPYPPGGYTEALAAQFPARDGDYLVVKQVITHE